MSNTNGRAVGLVIFTLVLAACMPPERNLVARDASNDVEQDSSVPDVAETDSGSFDADVGPEADASVPCQLSPQFGCDAAMNCVVVDTTGTTACITAGSSGPNVPCANLGDCAPGLACLDGLCKPYCSSKADCPGGDKRDCRAVEFGTADGGFSPIPGYSVCNEICDPTQADGACAKGTGCTWFAHGGDFYTDCAAAGAGAGTGTCSVLNPHSCASGYGCSSTLPFALIGCDQGYACPPQDFCGKYCVSPGTNSCGAGTICKPFAAFGTGEGMCVPP